MFLRMAQLTPRFERFGLQFIQQHIAAGQLPALPAGMQLASCKQYMEFLELHDRSFQDLFGAALTEPLSFRQTRDTMFQIGLWLSLHPGAIHHPIGPSRYDTPIAIAACNWPALMPVLLDHGADPNAEVQKGIRLLDWALSIENLAMVRLLVEHGADTRGLAAAVEDGLRSAAAAADPETRRFFESVRRLGKRSSSASTTASTSTASTARALSGGNGIADPAAYAAASANQGIPASVQAAYTQSSLPPGSVQPLQTIS